MLFPGSGSATGGVLVSVFVLLGVAVATAVWVHTDAQESARRGRPIVSSVGSIQLRTPVAWFVACLLLWEVVFPLYIDSRGMS